MYNCWMSLRRQQTVQACTVILLAALCACGSHNRGSPVPLSSPPGQEIESILAKGMATDELIRKLGHPAWVVDLRESATGGGYALAGFPATNEMKGTIVSGVIISVTNGHVAGGHYSSL